MTDSDNQPLNEGQPVGEPVQEQAPPAGTGRAKVSIFQIVYPLIAAIVVTAVWQSVGSSRGVGSYENTPKGAVQALWRVEDRAKAEIERITGQSQLKGVIDTQMAKKLDSQMGNNDRRIESEERIDENSARVIVTITPKSSEKGSKPKPAVVCYVCTKENNRWKVSGLQERCTECNGEKMAKCSICDGSGNTSSSHPCSSCGGSGYDYANGVTCSSCQGKGTTQEETQCSECNGTGKIKCPRCDGKAWMGDPKETNPSDLMSF